MKKVWEVDICFEPWAWASDKCLIGADSPEEILENIDVIFGKKFFREKEINELKKYQSDRIREIPGLFTDIPIKILKRWSYYYE